MQILNGKHAVCAAVITLALAAPARSQTRELPIAEPMSLSGPRFGLTVLSDGIIRAEKQASGGGRPATRYFMARS